MLKESIKEKQMNKKELENLWQLLENEDPINQKLGLELAKNSDLKWDIDDVIRERLKKMELYSYYTDSPEWLPTCSCGIYAHGKLEKELQFDIVNIPFGGEWEEGYKQFILPFKKGIHTVNINHHGKLIKARMYYWNSDAHGNGYYKHRGLIVHFDDEKANKYAKEHYNKKSYSI